MPVAPRKREPNGLVVVENFGVNYGGAAVALVPASFSFVFPNGDQGLVQQQSSNMKSQTLTDNFSSTEITQMIFDSSILRCVYIMYNMIYEIDTPAAAVEAGFLQCVFDGVNGWRIIPQFAGPESLGVDWTIDVSTGQVSAEMPVPLGGTVVDFTLHWRIAHAG